VRHLDLITLLAQDMVEQTSDMSFILKD